MLDITLLGCGGTRPLPGRALTALAVRCAGRTVLLDCGEGTQTAAQRWGVSLAKIDLICLTHGHGDHIFGLPGLLQTVAGLGRTAPLVVAGPPGVAQWGQALLALAGPLPFTVQLCPLPLAGAAPALPAPGGLRVQPFALAHRTECLGYRLVLPRAGRFCPQAAQALGVPQAQWKTLQNGSPVALPGGQTVQPEQVCGAPRRGLAVVYATDSRPCPALAQAARDADLLVMDATYADPAQADQAAQYGHSTFAQTAALAAQAEVRRLWLTHYSAALADPQAALPMAQAHFAAAEAGEDGKQLTLSFAPE